MIPTRIKMMRVGRLSELKSSRKWRPSARSYKSTTRTKFGKLSCTARLFFRV